MNYRNTSFTRYNFKTLTEKLHFLGFLAANRCLGTLPGSLMGCSIGCRIILLGTRLTPFTTNGFILRTPSSTDTLRTTFGVSSADGGTVSFGLAVDVSSEG